MQEAPVDSMFFRRFVGLGLQDDTPDYTTISRFRAELNKRGLSVEPFMGLEVQLGERGLHLNTGTLMAATLVEFQVRRPPVSADRCAESSKVFSQGGVTATQTGRMGRRLPTLGAGSVKCDCPVVPA